MADSQGEDRRHQRGGYRRDDESGDYERRDQGARRDDADRRPRHHDRRSGDHGSSGSRDRGSFQRNRDGEDQRSYRGDKDRSDRRYSRGDRFDHRDKNRDDRGNRRPDRYRKEGDDRRQSRGDRSDRRYSRGEGDRRPDRYRKDGDNRRHQRDDRNDRQYTRGDNRFDHRDGERRSEPRKPMKNPDLSAGPIRRGESRKAPDMPADIEFDYDDLDKETKGQLRTLNKQLAELVGKRMLATAALLEDDPDMALQHALYARSKASRVAAVREVAGVAAYYNGDWKLALAELKAAQRLTGTPDHVAMIADCERALDRPERAIDLYREQGNNKKIALATRVELLIVAAGARRDMGMGEAATVMLQVKLLNSQVKEEWVARLRFAYAEALLDDGRDKEGRRWLQKAVDADITGVIGASDRLLELDGVELQEDDAEEEGPDASDGEPETVDSLDAAPRPEESSREEPPEEALAEEQPVESTPDESVVSESTSPEVPPVTFASPIPAADDSDDPETAR